jgi:hypothetical protein
MLFPYLFCLCTHFCYSGSSKRIFSRSPNREGIAASSLPKLESKLVKHSLQVPIILDIFTDSLDLLETLIP